MRQARLILAGLILLLGSLIVPPATARPLEDETAELVEQLFQAKRDDQGPIMRRIGEIGPEAREAIPALIIFLRGERHSSIPAGTLADLQGEAIPVIFEQLRDGQLEYTRDVRRYQSALEYDAGPLLPFTLRRLRFGDQTERADAAKWLGDHPYWPEATVPALIAALGDRASSVRESVARSLGCFREHADKAIPALIVVAESDPDPRSRKSAISALAALDPDGIVIVPILAKALDDHSREPERDLSWGTPSVSEVAHRELSRVLRRSETAMSASVDRITRNRSWKDVFQFRDFTSPLARHPDAAHEALPFFVEEMQRELQPNGAGIEVSTWWAGQDTYYESMMVRVSAAAIVAAIDPKNEEALQILITTLDDERWSNHSHGTGDLFDVPIDEPRTVAADALGRLGPQAAAAIPAMHRILETKVENGRFLLQLRAAWALAQIDPHDMRCVSVFRELLEFRSWDSLLGIEDAETVARAFGKRLSAFVPEMFQNVEFYEHPKRRYFVDLAVHGGMVDELIKYEIEKTSAEDRDDDRELQGMRRIFWELGPRAEPAIDLLLESLNSPHHHVRSECAWLLGRIEGHDEQIAAALTELLDDPRVAVRARAAESLAEIGPGASVAVEQLRERLMDDSPWVRREANEALSRIP